MKTAEEVAANIIRVVDHFALSVRESTVVQIVTAYADERVKEFRREIVDAASNESKAIQIVRAEALEEAAKIADKNVFGRDCSCSMDIRALKDKK